MHIIFLLIHELQQRYTKRDNNKKYMLIRSPQIIKPHITVFSVFMI